MSQPLFHVTLGAASTGRIWQLHIPAPGPWLTANPRRNNYYARSAEVRRWRQAAADAGEKAGLPKGIDYARIDGIARHHGRAPVRDRDNLRPTIKAAVDGLTPEKWVVRKGVRRHYPGCGLLVDDSDKHLAGTDITFERLPGTGRDELVLIIKEILR